MVKKVLYIYGYGSSPEGHTATWLKEHLPYSEVYSFKYSQTDPENSIPYLVSLVEELDIDIVIGSSLGGWYAMHVSSIANIPCVLINPLTDDTLDDVIYNVTKGDITVVSKLVKYSTEHPLFSLREHWTGYRWDDRENGDFALLIWSDNDEVINEGKELPDWAVKNFYSIKIVHEGKHQLTDKEKEDILIPSYIKFIDETIPKVNNFYKKTMIIP